MRIQAVDHRGSDEALASTRCSREDCSDRSPGGKLRLATRSKARTVPWASVQQCLSTVFPARMRQWACNARWIVELGTLDLRELVDRYRVLDARSGDPANVDSLAACRAELLHRGFTTSECDQLRALDA